MNHRYFSPSVLCAATLVLQAPLTPILRGQSSSSGSLPAKPPVTAPATPAPVRMTKLAAPLFMEDQTYTSTVGMVNGGSSPLQVEVLLYSLTGEELKRTTVEVPPHSPKAVSLGELLQSTASRYGSVVLAPQSAPTMAAQLSIAGRNGSAINDIEEEFQVMNGSYPSVYRGTGVAGESFIAARNLSNQPQALSVVCLESEKRISGDVRVGPNQSVLIDACAAEGPTLLTEAPHSGKNRKSNAGPVAFSVSSAAAAKDLAVFGFGFTGGNQQGSNSGLAAIPFADIGGLKSATAVFPGVAPTGSRAVSYEAAIANFGASTRQVTVELSVGGTNGTPKILASQAIEPHSVARVPLNAGMDGMAGTGSITIRSEAQPGEVVGGIQVLGTPQGAAASVTLPRKDLKQVNNGGQHPWRIDGGFDSTLMLSNPDAKTAASVVVAVYAGGKVWMKKVDVAAQTTFSLDMHDLVKEQRADDKKNTLPSETVSGFVAWYTLAAPKVFGMMNQVDSTTGLVRPYACGETIAACGMTLYDNGMSPGSTSNDFPTPLTCVSYGDCSCASSCDYNGSANMNYYFWQSGNSGIASLISPVSASYGQYQGVSPGSTYAWLNATDNLGCNVSGSGNIYVNQVTIDSADVTTDTISTTLSPGSGSGPFSLWLADDSGSTTYYLKTSVNRSGGTYSDSFNVNDSMPVTTFANVFSAWTVAGFQVVAQRANRFQNLGRAHHTQYAAVQESTCSGGQTPVYVITNLGACFSNGLQNSMLKSDFASQTRLNGTGQSQSLGLLKPLAATSCAGATANKPADASNQNTVVEVSSVTGSCNTSLGNSNVAAYNHQCGQTIQIEGYPAAGTRTQKTVQDECPACGNDPPHFDNFTTNAGGSCSKSVGDLPPGGYFVTLAP